MLLQGHQLAFNLNQFFNAVSLNKVFKKLRFHQKPSVDGYNIQMARVSTYKKVSFMQMIKRLFYLCSSCFHYFRKSNCPLQQPSSKGPLDILKQLSTQLLALQTDTTRMGPNSLLMWQIHSFVMRGGVLSFLFVGFLSLRLVLGRERMGMPTSRVEQLSKSLPPSSKI